MANLVPYRPNQQLAKDHPARRLVDAFLKGRSASTVRAYAQDLLDFTRYLQGRRIIPLIGTGSEEAAAYLLSRRPGEANELVLSYRNDLIDVRKLGPATVNRRLAAIRSLVKLARTLGMVSWSIEIEGVDVTAYRDTRGPGNDAVRKMLKAVATREDPKGTRDRAILRLLYDRALRRGEVCSLDLEHFDVERGLSILGKGRKQREWVSLPEAAREALVAWVDVRGEEPGPLFTALDSRSFGHRLTGSAIYAIVRALGADVGVKTRPHGLRHTAITTALDKTNGNTRAVQSFSRHVDPRTLGRYDDNRRDMAGEIADLVSVEIDDSPISGPGTSELP